MNHDLTFEKQYWGDCTNTFDEEQKHFVYAKYMGLDIQRYSFDVKNKSILDVGGGPVSMLLKAVNLKKGKVIDPIDYPYWVKQRYGEKGIDFEVNSGEKMGEFGWDEVWLYNCLQHVENVYIVLNNCLNAGVKLRIFEWIDIPPHEGHPHTLTKGYLDNMIGINGNVVDLAEQGCYGRAYYGVKTR